MTPTPDYVHQITLPTPFPVGPVHVYLLEGEPLTLVDTGPRTPEALQELEAGLALLGYSIEDLVCIVITHAHADHCGLAAELAERSGAAVWAHSGCAAHLSGQVGHGEGMRWYAQMLTSAGVPLATQLRVASGFSEVDRHSATVEVAHYLEDGERLRLGGEMWEVLHSPGHSADLICLYQPQAGVLLGSDHLIKHISSNAIIEPPEQKGQPRRRPLVEYWASLKRIRAMEIGLVLSAHGEPIADHRALIDKRFAFYQKRLSAIRGVLSSGVQTVWSIVQSLFSRLGGIDTFLAVSEILGHLDVMEEAGEVRQTTEDAVWRYRLEHE